MSNFRPIFVSHGQRIGLLGGSFNPAHLGHRAMTLQALKQLDLDQVWWLVTPQNPLKSVTGMASLNTRLAEAKRLANHPRIVVTDIEAQFGTRYTIDLLRQLRRRYPDIAFVWLMGADNMRQVTYWRNWVEIFKTVPVAVFRRPAYAAGRGVGKAAQRFSKAWLPAKAAPCLADKDAPAWLVLDHPLNYLSATDIRKERKWQK